MTAANRKRGKWASPSQAMRGAPKRGFGLPRDLHDALDAMRDRGVNLSALCDRALRADAEVSAELARLKKNDGSSQKGS